MKRLRVIYEGWGESFELGLLADDGQRLLFEYTQAALDRGLELSPFRLAQSEQWRIAPAYDITFNHGPAGEHQMDICGEARAPGRSHLLKLAELTGVRTAYAVQTIERITEVAGGLQASGANYPISVAALGEMVAAVEANRARMN